MIQNSQYLGPLGYSSLGYTSINTVKSQNKKDEHNHLENTQVSSLPVTITISHHHLDDKQVSPSLLPPRSALDVLPQSFSAYPGSSAFFNQVILILICKTIIRTHVMFYTSSFSSSPVFVASPRFLMPRLLPFLLPTSFPFQLTLLLLFLLLLLR